MRRTGTCCLTVQISPGFSRREIVSKLGATKDEIASAKTRENAMKHSIKITVPAELRGMNLIDTPLWNKRTAFSDDERAAFALEGLLPPQVESI
jgi:hypothetical protein